MNKNKQSDFSKIFLENYNPWSKQEPFKEKFEKSQEHPFIYFENYLADLNSYPNFKEFNKAQILFKNINTLQIESYQNFELEYSVLQHNKIKYLNTIVSKLISIQNDLKTIKRKEIIKNHNSINILISLLLSSTKDILKNIFISCHLELNNTNREMLSKWFYLKKSITSFKFQKYPEDKRLERLFLKYLTTTKFISPITKFSTFKALFEGKQLENKINWIDRKSSLYYFIKLLISNNIVQNPKNKHWEITSEFFLLKGESLLHRDFLNQKETQNKNNRDILESFVKALTI